MLPAPLLICSGINVEVANGGPAINVSVGRNKSAVARVRLLGLLDLKFTRLT